MGQVINLAERRLQRAQHPIDPLNVAIWSAAVASGFAFYGLMALAIAHAFGRQP